MDFVSHVLIVMIICSSFFNSPSPTFAVAAAANAPSKLLKDVCGRTKNYTFCVGALESDPRTASATHLLALAEIALEVAMANATNTRTYIDHMLKNNDTKPSRKPSLKSCVSNYDGVIGSFRSALLEVIEDKEYMTANYDVLVAGDEAKYCEQSLASDGVRDLSITRRNNFVMHFSNIGYVVTDLLDRGSPPHS